MQVIHGGDEIDLYVNWVDSDGEKYDPAEVTVSIVRNFVNVVYAGFSLSNNRVVYRGPGEYQLTITIDDFLVPGNYTAKWEADINGTPTVYTEVFALVDEPPVFSEVLDPPRRYGQMRESFRYEVLGVGLTDTIFLVGHADGIGINSPFRVINIQEAVNAIGADTACPLLRAMLEAYNSGARDIWLVASAPMSEYIPVGAADHSARFVGRAEWGGDNFYERYNQRLLTTYDALDDWENVEILVPVEAAFHDSGGVNFLDPLVFNCYKRFRDTGFVSIGILGTQIGSWTDQDLIDMQNHDIIQGLGDFSKQAFLDYISDTQGADMAAEVADNLPYKFGLVVFGEGNFTLPQITTAYTGSVAATAAGLLSASRLDQGLTYRELPNISAPIGRDLSQDQVKTLCNLRINPFIRTVQARRGRDYKSVIATDNLFMPDGTDFWSVVQMRLVGKVVNQIKLLGNRAIGTIAYETFKRDVQEMLDLLVVNGQLRGFNLNIYRRPSQEDTNQTVYVSLGLTPYSGVRELFFVVEVGPGI